MPPTWVDGTQVHVWVQRSAQAHLASAAWWPFVDGSVPAVVQPPSMLVQLGRFPVETSRASSRSYTVRVRSWPHPTVRGVCAGHLGRRSRTIRQSADPVSVGGRPPRIDAPFGAQPWSRLPGRTAQPPQLTGSCPSTSAFAALAAGLEPAVGNDSDHSDVGLNLRGADITVLLSKFC
jgi:hypothetical protein